ncbi:MAG: hypothetical protein HRU15_05170, partial [Planctomycetes bacterium]|nr:hypothetical protein [Planctomycetota bacterium]
MAENIDGNGEEPRPMSQDEINSLFKQLEDEVDSEPVESIKEDTTQDASNGTPQAGALHQNDINNLLDEVAAEDNKPPEDGPQSPMGQDDIDSLLNSLQGDVADSAAETENKSAPEPASDDGPLGQDAIDAMLNSLQGGEETPSVPEPSAPAPVEAEAAAPAVQASLGQDDIDALINQMHGEPEEESTPAVAASEPAVQASLGQDDIDSLIAQMSGEPAAVEAPPVPPPPAAEDGKVLGQDDIDAFLNSMSGGDEPAAEPV